MGRSPFRPFSLVCALAATLACASSQGFPEQPLNPEDQIKVEFSSRKVREGSLFFVKVVVPPRNPHFGGDTPKGQFKDVKVPFFVMDKGSPVQNLPHVFGGVVPVPYQSKPESTALEVTLGEDGISLYEPFEIVSGNYPSETLRVNKKRVTLAPKDLERAIAEKKEVTAIYKTQTPVRYWEGEFVLPVRSKITSIYGSKRVYNGVMKSFHRGTDLRAPVGTPIKSTAGGRVVLAKDLFYTGYTVLVDHGYGIYTLYAHLSKLRSKKGDLVKKGQLLGLAGATGRVNGPHLHWGAIIYGHKVDPMYLTRVMQ